MGTMIDFNIRMNHSAMRKSLDANLRVLACTCSIEINKLLEYNALEQEIFMMTTIIFGYIFSSVGK